MKSKKRIITKEDYDYLYKQIKKLPLIKTKFEAKKLIDNTFNYKELKDFIDHYKIPVKHQKKFMLIDKLYDYLFQIQYNL